jgi:tetratricopeptide (TPR) repeat protein
MKKEIAVWFMVMVAAFANAQSSADTDTTSEIAVEMASPQTQWDAANTMYSAGNYDEASTLYMALIDKHGIENQYLYYNAANAFFKQNEIAKAILYYEKALKLAPDNEDLRHNLQIAQHHAADKIDAVPVFFIIRWLEALPQLLAADVWGYASLIAFAAALAFLLLITIMRRKILLVTLSAGMLALSLITLRLGALARNNMIEHTSAIVMMPVTTVKSSPDNNSTDLFILHEGAKVQVLETIGAYAKIRIADGNQGWVPQKNIETI